MHFRQKVFLDLSIKPVFLGYFFLSKTINTKKTVQPWIRHLPPLRIGTWRLLSSTCISKALVSDATTRITRRPKCGHIGDPAENKPWVPDKCVPNLISSLWTDGVLMGVLRSTDNKARSASKDENTHRRPSDWSTIRRLWNGTQIMWTLPGIEGTKKRQRQRLENKSDDTGVGVLNQRGQSNI